MNRFTPLQKFQQKSILILKRDTKAAFDCMQDESLPWLGTSHFSQSWIDNAGYNTLFCIHTVTKYNLLKKVCFFLSSSRSCMGATDSWRNAALWYSTQSITKCNCLDLWRNAALWYSTQSITKRNWIHGGMQHWYCTQSITKRNCLDSWRNAELWYSTQSITKRNGLDSWRNAALILYTKYYKT